MDRPQHHPDCAVATAHYDEDGNLLPMSHCACGLLQALADVTAAGKRRLEREHFVALQRQALADAGLSPDEVETAMEPLLSFNAMCEENEAEDADMRQGG